MFPEDHEFWIHSTETNKHLFVTRTERIKSDALSPCCMTPDDVDYEMAQGKHSQMLEICGMNQQSFEYFVTHYGKTYRYLYFFKSQQIQDFSPLEDLENLEAVDIYWNIRADNLWNMQRNKALKAIRISDAKKMSLKPDLVRTSPTLEAFYLSGSVWGRYPLESLEIFAGMPSLMSLCLWDIKLLDRSMDALASMPELCEFRFDPGMLTTEEIAAICARYPHISGYSLRPYCPQYYGATSSMRVCGYRKPTLELPEQQHLLDKHVKKFNDLVEKYRTELH